MKCYFCKRDETETEKQFSPLFLYWQKEILRLDSRAKEKQSDYMMENQLFMKENKEKVNLINENILNMKIDYFRENYKLLLPLDANLESLANYLNTYNPKVSDTDTLKTLAALFAGEPTEERLRHLVTDTVNEKEKIHKDIEHTKSEIKFTEVEENNIEFVKKIEEKIMLNIVGEKKYYFELNKANQQSKIVLCPFCLSLFNMNQLSEEIKDKILREKLESLKGAFDHIQPWDFDRGRVD